MSSQTYNIHVIKKNDIASHTTVPLTTTLPPLQAGHVRVRTVIAGLTSNNLSYAKAGTILKWWDGFPVPSDLPAPYKNSEEYGIVPVWGYGEIWKSKVDGLQEGRLMWGFWASHSMPIDLKLEKAADSSEGHFIERSQYRSGMMSLYQRYSTSPAYPSLLELRSDHSVKDKLGWASSAGALHEAGWTIPRFIFNPSNPIHPLGRSGGPWTPADADISKSVLISMSASGKTARAFTDSLLHSSNAKPLALLAITSSSDPTLIPQSTSTPTHLVQYSSLTSPSTTSWILKHSPSRILILDFASRGKSLQLLLSHLKPTNIKTTVLGIGGEAKPHSPSELATMAQERAAMSERVQMNMSGLRDAALDMIGAKRYFEERDAAWEGFVERGGLKGMKLEWGDDVGDVWRSLCEQKVGTDVCMAVQL